MVSHLLLLLILFALVSAPVALAEESSLRLCQLLEIDRGLPTVEPVPSAGPEVLKGSVDKQGAHSSSKLPAPKIDATPIMCWIDDGSKVKAAIVCVHGLGLHKGTYSQFGERMAKTGYAVYAMDVRGFGTFLEMPGERRCDFPRCLDDVYSALHMVHKAHPNVPVFLVGESMGGAIALRVTAEHPDLVDGLISSVPAAERYGQTSSSIKVGMHLLASPNKEMDVTDVVVKRSTQKEDLREAWLKDPLARFSLTPVELVQFQHFMVANEQSAKKITKTPVLMLQGTSDKLVRHDANENIVKHIPSPDSQLVFVDSAEHLILEEGQFNDGVITLLSDWLQNHLKVAPATASGNQVR